MLYPTVLIVCLALLSGCVATAVVGGAAAAGSAAYDERSVARHAEDVAIAARIDARLIAEKDMPSRWVSVEVIDGVAILTGYLPTRQHIERAIYIVKNVRGVRRVRSELKIGRPKASGVVSDSWITTKVKAALFHDPVVSGFGIHVETVDGKVYLQGIVSKQSQRRRAIDVARSVDGVRSVVDLITVR